MEDIKVGQIWKEVDNRFTRLVRVVRVDDIGFIDIQTIFSSTDSSITKDNPGKITISNRKRFNGKHGGYKLIPEII